MISIALYKKGMTTTVHCSASTGRPVLVDDAAGFPDTGRLLAQSLENTFKPPVLNILLQETVKIMKQTLLWHHKQLRKRSTVQHC